MARETAKGGKGCSRGYGSDYSRKYRIKCSGNGIFCARRCFFSSKKAVATWISWVLLVAFVIFIGTTMFYWMKDFSINAMENLGDRVKTSEKCDLISLQLSDVTSKNAQTLNMKVTNRDNLRIDQIEFSLYGNRNSFIWTNTSNTTLKPNSTKEIDIPQNSSLLTLRVEAVPVIIDQGKPIKCTERKVEANVTG